MSSRQSIRAAALSLIALCGGMLSLRVYSYPLFFSQNGAAKLFIEIFALLLIYAGFAVWQTRNDDALLTRITPLGIVAATIQVIHLGVERFIDVPGRWNGPLAIAAMVITFSTFALAGFSAARHHSNLLASCRWAVWCAGVAMLIAVTAGFALLFWIAPLSPESMRGWNEFRRSGWNDLQAFDIANTIDSALSHLAIAPVVAVLFGAAGWGVARITESGWPSPTGGTPGKLHGQ